MHQYICFFFEESAASKIHIYKYFLCYQQIKVHILLYFIIMTCHILFITNIISMYVILINNEKMFVCGLFYNRLLQHYWQTTTSLGLLSWMEMVHYLEHCQGTLEKFYINLLWISPKNMVK